MKVRVWSFATALLAILLSGAVAFSYAQQATDNAGNATAGWRAHRRAGMERIARELNLTDAQKAQIKEMFQAQRATTQPLKQQMAQNRLALLNATSGGAFDQAKVQALANQQAQLAAQLQVLKTQLRSQIYNQVLTPDQKAKADQFRQKQITRINEHLQKWSQAGAEPTAQ